MGHSALALVEAPVRRSPVTGRDGIRPELVSGSRMSSRSAALDHAPPCLVGDGRRSPCAGLGWIATTSDHAAKYLSAFCKRPRSKCGQKALKSEARYAPTLAF